MEAMKKTIILSLCFMGCIFYQSVFAQVQINFQSSIYGKTLDGLTFFQVSNQTSSDFSASLRIIITEEKSGKVAEINAPSLLIKRGMTSFNRSLFGSAQTKFSSTELAIILKQTGKFPEGEYEFCYELSPIGDKLGLLDVYEYCFHFNSQPLTPLLLIDPLDGEKICNQKPAFLWQAPMPFDLNAKYRIIVAEIKEKQSPIEALSFNQPIINVSELREPRINYPMNLKELEKGKTYVWQIHYSVNNILLSKSEVWTFKIDCEEEKQVLSDDSYRELQSEISGDFYVAKGKLRFALTNSYNEGDLSFSIINLKEPEKSISNLPKLKLASGLNKYELNLSEYRTFRNGEHYQLQVQLLNGEKLFLRFTYQE